MWLIPRQIRPWQFLYYEKPENKLGNRLSWLGAPFWNDTITGRPKALLLCTPGSVRRTIMHRAADPVLRSGFATFNFWQILPSIPKLLDESPMPLRRCACKQRSGKGVWAAHDLGVKQRQGKAMLLSALEGVLQQAVKLLLLRSCFLQSLITMATRQAADSNFMIHTRTPAFTSFQLRCALWPFFVRGIKYNISTRVRRSRRASFQIIAGDWGKWKAKSKGSKRSTHIEQLVSLV